MTVVGAPMTCRNGCGACCIAPSISSPIPGMPEGKPAGVRCAQLTDDNRCAIFGSPERPACCAGLQPSPEMCGDDRIHALSWLGALEAATRTDGPQGRLPPKFEHETDKDVTETRE